MDKNHIKKVISNYLEKENTEYAILLNGVWGSGKTFFWKKEIEKECEIKEFKPIYVSLNGVNSIAEIDQKLLLSFTPFISENKHLKAIGKVAINTTNILTKFFLKNELKDVFNGVDLTKSLDMSKYILCFDDLERCKIDIVEILGYINDYVEHSYQKVILLADETKISKETEYSTIKEKLIRLTLTYEVKLDEIIPQLFSKYHSDFFRFLETNQEQIIRLFENFEQKNLRVILFYLEILESLYSIFNSLSNEIQNEIIFFATIISIEFKEGRLISSDYKNYKDLDNHSLIQNIGFNKNIEKNYLNTFFDTYLKINLSPYHFYPSVYSYILSGYFDEKIFLEELNQRKKLELLPHTQNFNKLLRYQFRFLSNKEFKVLKNAVLDDAEKGTYSIYQYSQIFEFYSFFCKEEMIEETSEEIEKKLLKGINNSSLTTEFNSMVFQQVFHFKDKMNLSIIDYELEKIHLKKQNEKYKSNGENCINFLENNEIQKLRELFTEYLTSVNLLPTIDQNEFITVIAEKTSNELLFQLQQLLIIRYQSINIGEFLYQDKIWLEEVRKKLNDYLTLEKVGQPTKLMLKELGKTMKVSAEHLENTKKQL